jgi:hypothetical protein
MTGGRPPTRPRRRSGAPPPPACGATSEPDDGTETRGCASRGHQRDLAATDPVRRQVTVLAATAEKLAKRLQALEALLAGRPHVDRDPARSRLETTEVAQQILEHVPRDGWIKVVEAFRPVRTRTQLKYQALRTLVDSGRLARRCGRIARAEWVEGARQ